MRADRPPIKALIELTQSWLPLARQSVARLTMTAMVLIMVSDVAPARTRVETGRDLLTYCQMAADQHLTSVDAPLRGKARYCRQYVSGFFASLQAMYINEGTRKVHGNDEPERVQCTLVPQTATYRQLELQIVRHGEWHPELLDEPAYELIQRAFDVLDPC